MNVPQLRFDGFDGEWLEKKIGEIGEVITGNTPASANRDFYEGDFSWASPTDLGRTKYVYYTKTMLTKEGFKKMRFLPKGTVLVTCIGSTIGKMGIAGRGMSSNQQINGIVVNEGYNSEFIYYSLLNTFPRFLNTISTQAIPIINKTLFSSFILKIPAIREQQKITSFFKLLDQKNEKQQEKIEKLEQFKKGMMQKIFSQELRFKDEDGVEFPEWKVRRLDELGSFYKGSGLSKSHLTSKGKSCILYGEIYTKYSSVITKVYSYCNPEAKAFLGEVNDVLIPSSGETAWDIACASALNVSDVVLGGDLNVFRPNQQIDGSFISYQINTIKKHELSNLAQGASVVHLYSAALKKLEVFVPVYEEQLNISEYLSKIDKKIEKEKEKLLVLEEQKKGFMQGMLV